MWAAENLLRNEMREQVTAILLNSELPSKLYIWRLPDNFEHLGAAVRSSGARWTAVAALYPSRSRTILSAFGAAAKLRGAFTDELF